MLLLQCASFGLLVYVGFTARQIDHAVAQAISVRDGETWIYRTQQLNRTNGWIAADIAEIHRLNRIDDDDSFIFRGGK